MPALGLVQLFPVPRPQTVSSQTRLLVSPLGPLHQQGWTRVDIEKELVSNYAFLWFNLNFKILSLENF